MDLLPRQHRQGIRRVRHPQRLPAGEDVVVAVRPEGHAIELVGGEAVRDACGRPAVGGAAPQTPVLDGDEHAAVGERQDVLGTSGVPRAPRPLRGRVPVAVVVDAERYRLAPPNERIIGHH